MGTTTGYRQRSMAVMAVMLLLLLVAPASVGADVALSLDQQKLVNRITVGLVTRGLPLASVLSFSVGMETCLGTGGGLTCIEKALTDNNIPPELLDQVTGATGTWSVYFGVCNPQCSNYRTGRVNVGREYLDTTTQAHLTYTQGGFSDLTLTPDSTGDYDFTWTNSFGQGGTGYLVWTDDGCFLYGAYFDSSDSSNTGIVVFRRC